MLGSKSNSKKQFTTKPKTNASESSMKRYKSQDVYLVTKKQVSDNTPKLSSVTVKKPQSPKRSLISSRMNSYMINRPKPGPTENVGNRLTNDESIQELDTEENSK